MTSTSRIAASKLNPLSQLQSAASVQGLPVGGLWRLRDDQIEVQRFGGVWNRPPLQQLQKGPRNLLVWNKQLALAPG